MAEREELEGTQGQGVQVVEQTQGEQSQRQTQGGQVDSVPGSQRAVIKRV